ncbi:MAG: PqqD family protein [Christensenellaceae bacterium]|jgi:hypothetical protein
MAIRLKSRKNLLDMVPQKNAKYEWQLDETTGRVQITVERNSMIERAVRKFAKTPKTLTVDLDNFGSFVWQMIDGTRDIHAIGRLVADAFGKEAEPLYERLGGFMNLLKNNGFINYSYNR